MNISKQLIMQHKITTNILKCEMTPNYATFLQKGEYGCEKLFHCVKDKTQNTHRKLASAYTYYCNYLKNQLFILGSKKKKKSLNYKHSLHQDKVVINGVKLKLRTKGYHWIVKCK